MLCGDETTTRNSHSALNHKTPAEFATRYRASVMSIAEKQRIGQIVNLDFANKPLVLLLAASHWFSSPKLSTHNRIGEGRV